jgi:hypothetical protein
MSLTKCESDIQHLSVSVADAYSLCSDFRYLELFRNRVSDPAVADAIGAAPPKELEELRKYVSDVHFDADSIQLTTQMGLIVMRIVEREEKCVKLASEGSPIPVYMWVQLLPEGDAASKMKLTLGVDVNFFMKSVVSKPLRQATDILAEALVKIIQRFSLQNV